jgi:nicotinamidase/pyrazinamidase
MKKAFLAVDIQNDFLPGGSLAVREGDLVIPLINKLVKDFDIVVASKDWHPSNHSSFAKNHGKKVGEKILLKGLEQILWPVHCVQGSEGAEFSSDLDTSYFEKTFFKGTERDIDSYSAFFDNGLLKSTGLGEYLKGKKVTDLYIAGLTTDYCVKFSVLDAIQLGFKVYVILDACRAVNLKPGDNERVVDEMKDAGAEITTTAKVLKLSG